MKLTAAPASAEDWSTAGPPDRTAVHIRSVRRITAALWAVTLLAALAALALTVVSLGRPEAQRRDHEPVYPGGGGRLRHARCADHPPCGQPDRLDHARRGYRARVSRADLPLRDSRGRASWVAPGGEAGRHAVRVHLLPGGLPHRLHVPALPDREAAIATLAPGRRGRLPAGGPDRGRAGRDATAAASARAGRYIAGLPESAGRRESGACPAGGPRRHPQWASGGLRRIHGGGAGVARRPVPRQGPADAAADQMAGAGGGGIRRLAVYRPAGHRSR